MYSCEKVLNFKFNNYKYVMQAKVVLQYNNCKQLLDPFKFISLILLTIYSL